MSKELISLRLSEKTKNKLDSLAKATGRTRTFLAMEAIEKYCDFQAWQIEAVQDGIRAADAGKFVNHKDIKEKWENRRANTLDNSGRE